MSAPMDLIGAAWRRLPPQAAFSGFTAAWLHGLDVEPCAPIQATVPKDAGVSGRSGIALRRSSLGQDALEVRGVRTTTMARTLCDLCCQLTLTEAVVLADAALHKRRITLDELATWADLNRYRHGIQALRRVIDLAEPATESPMESRLRLVLVLNGLPRPKAQVPIHDAVGRFVGRPDLFYETHRLAIEYDGDIHRSTLVEDNRRQNRMISAGVRLLRFTGSDVLGRPNSVVAQVRFALVPAQTRVATVASKKVPALSVTSGLLGLPAPQPGALR